MKGSLTVEATFIFPFCFFAIGLICYLGVFLYNQSVLEMTGYECILQTMEERELGEEMFSQHLLQRAKQAANDRTLGLEELQTDLKITSSKIVLSYEGVQVMLGVPVEVDVIYEKTSPELTLKLIKGIGE